MDFKHEIYNSIQGMADRAVASCKVDRTYKTVIKRTAKNGYVVVDRSGSERTVPCCIPGLELRPMQVVWIKEPMSDVKGIHICGVAGT